MSSQELLYYADAFGSEHVMSLSKIGDILFPLLSNVFKEDCIKYGRNETFSF